MLIGTSTINWRSLSQAEPPGLPLHLLHDLLNDSLILGSVYEMSSPATPGVIFCFTALVLLIFVCIRRILYKFESIISHLRIHRYLYPCRPGTVFTSSVHPIEGQTIVSVCSVTLGRKHE
jgi:hypothetical protein